MSASNKRPKTTPVALSQNDSNDSTTSLLTHEIAIRDAVSKVISDVASLDTSDTTGHVATSIRNNILKLKGIQRQLYTKLYNQKSEYDDLTKQFETISRNNAAEQYERCYLEGEISKLKSYQMNSFGKLASSENKTLEGDNIVEPEVMDAISSFLNEDNQTSTFLDVSDPEKKKEVLDFLQKQIDRRCLLSSVVRQKESDFELLKKEVKNKRDFLNALPSHLDAIERASQSVAKFFTKSSLTTIANHPTLAGQNPIMMSGKDRLIRIDTARRLSPPLYTLFSCIQHYIDRIVEAKDDTEAQSKPSIKVIAPEKKQESGLFLLDHHQQVTLVLPVPEYSLSGSTIVAVSNNSAKKVQIQFRYYSQLSVITALATGCGTTLNQDILLDELFPGDTSVAAEAMVKTKVSMVQSTVEHSERNAQTPLGYEQQLTGISYQWCNVMGGLYQIPPGDNKDEVLVHSTRVVVNELIRRARANAILKFCIQSLKKHIIPDIPSFLFSANQESHELLHGWKVSQFTGTVQTEKVPSQDFVVHEMQFENGSNSFIANLYLHRARYPSVPPKWKIRTTNIDEQLFDTLIAHVEQGVNEDLLSRYEKDEKAVEWILIFQIRELVSLWECMLRDSFEVSSSESGLRKKRGRDHAPL